MRASSQAALWLGTAGLTLFGGVLLAHQPAGEPCLAKFSTSLASRTRNQRHNAILAAQYLDGAVLKPGETLSFNKRVGTWSHDVGYRKAPVSYNGQLIPSWGGGVCQASTTLYNAALLAGLEIVERHPHRFAIGYCPPGRDAAVAFSLIDLKIRNPYAFPIRIDTRAENESLSVSVFGAKRLADRARILTEIHETDAPMTFVANYGLPRGHVRNTGKPGFEVATYRLIGERKELVSTDTYPVVHRVVEYR